PTASSIRSASSTAASASTWGWSRAWRSPTAPGARCETTAPLKSRGEAGGNPLREGDDRHHRVDADRGREQRAIGDVEVVDAVHAHPSLRAIGEVDADRADVAEAEHRLLVLTPGAQQPGAAERQRREGRLEQDALRLPLIDVVTLHHALPAPHLLRVAGADPG